MIDDMNEKMCLDKSTPSERGQNWQVASDQGQNMGAQRGGDDGEIWLVDKPAGMSSFGVVARVRRQCSERAGWIEVKGKDGQVRRKRRKVKVGHTGTLDPFATGLLVILIGKATKRANEFLKLDKEYLATVRLGEISTTGDPEGEITEQVVREKPNKMAVEKAVEKLVGENWQTVPAFSAVKINGQRAYKLAREGKTVEMPRRKVQIYELEVLRYEWPELDIRCKVSSGTYIRTLGEEIGRRLGTGAYLTALRRTQVGPYRIEQARTLEELGSQEEARS